VIGGGPIGTELAQAFHRLGTKVTLTHSRDRLLPRDDAELAGELTELLKRDGLDIRLNSRVREVEKTENVIVSDGASRDNTLKIAGQYANHDTFRELGGFAGVPIMADVEFSHRVKKVGKTTLLPGPVMTSSRKFDNESAWRTLYLIVYALAAFRLNINLQIVKDKYFADKPKREGDRV
jgi:hypothetical protein